MKLNKTLLLATLSLLAASGLMAKQQAKEEIPGMAAQPPSYYYIGKPYDADLGAYTFNYRNYDSVTARWTSADPSGFPDGANDRIYAPTPTNSLDPFGLEINTIGGVITWYNNGNCCNATLGLQIINGIKASGDYLTQIATEMGMSINTKLGNMNKSQSSGTIVGSGLRGLNYGSIPGSLSLHINYSSQWTASAWIAENSYLGEGAFFGCKPIALAQSTELVIRWNNEL